MPRAFPERMRELRHKSPGAVPSAWPFACHYQPRKLNSLHVSCRTGLVVFTDDTDEVLAAMRAHPLGRESAIVGVVTADAPGRVLQRTAFGTRRVVTMLAGDQLPRIC